MREIKFRAWDTSGKFMFANEDIGSLVFYEGGGIHVESKGDEFPCVVLMQYTGFTDKNGKEIWEGDIIIVEDTFTDVVTDDGRGPQEACNHLCPVIFKNGTFGLDMLEMGDVYYKGFQAFGHVIAQQGVFPDEMEVIGNIFENPDLVQGEYKL